MARPILETGRRMCYFQTMIRAYAALSFRLFPLVRPGRWFFPLLLAIGLVLAPPRTGWPDVAEEDLDLLEEAFEAHTNDRFDEAIAIYTRIVQSEHLERSDQAVVYLLRGQAFSDKGDCANAILDFSKAVELREDYAHAFYFRSLCRQQLKSYEDAWQDINKAITLKPDKVLYQKNRALLAALMGREVPPAPAQSAAGKPAAASAVEKKAEPKPTGLLGFLRSRIAMLKSLIGLGKK